MQDTFSKAQIVWASLGEEISNLAVQLIQKLCMVDHDRRAYMAAKPIRSDNFRFHLGSATRGLHLSRSLSDLGLAGSGFYKDMHLPRKSSLLLATSSFREKHCETAWNSPRNGKCWNMHRLIQPVHDTFRCVGRRETSHTNTFRWHSPVESLGSANHHA